MNSPQQSRRGAVDERHRRGRSRLLVAGHITQYLGFQARDGGAARRRPRVGRRGGVARHLERELDAVQTVRHGLRLVEVARGSHRLPRREPAARHELVYVSPSRCETRLMSAGARRVFAAAAALAGRARSVAFCSGPWAIAAAMASQESGSAGRSGRRPARSPGAPAAASARPRSVRFLTMSFAPVKATRAHGLGAPDHPRGARRHDGDGLCTVVDVERHQGDDAPGVPAARRRARSLGCAARPPRRRRPRPRPRASGAATPRGGVRRRPRRESGLDRRDGGPPRLW